MNIDKNYQLKSQHGMSLVELLVALVIGLVVSLAIYGVLTASEGRKRTTTSINDIDKAGTFALFQLDQVLRSAGSGLVGGITSGSGIQAASYTVGCQINAANNGTQVLPAPATLPAPFDALPAPLNASPINFRLAPAIIMNGAAGAGGDVLMVMSGSGGLAETPSKFSAVPTTSTFNVKTVAGFTAGDIALVARAPSATAISPCLIEQVSSALVPTAGASVVPLSGQYYQATVNGLALSSYPVTAVALNLGKDPIFNLFAVGSNNTLFKYDLLKPPTADTVNDPNPSPFVDSVFQMHALYGVYTTPGNVATFAWVAPTGAYSAANLLAGTPAANAALMNIKAIKIGLVLRSSLLEKDTVSANKITLFGSTGATKVEIDLTALNYRYRTVEVTVPLRNPLM
ncbi:MAG: PilW family protein [Candidatus Methylopumilus sp.]|jgi:type IV pilus assembly protein PilW